MASISALNISGQEYEIYANSANTANYAVSAGAAPVASHQLSSHTNFSTYFNGTSANSALTAKSALSAGSAAKAVSASYALNASALGGVTATDVLNSAKSGAAASAAINGAVSTSANMTAAGNTGKLATVNAITGYVSNTVGDFVPYENASHSSVALTANNKSAKFSTDEIIVSNAYSTNGNTATLLPSALNLATSPVAPVTL